MAPKLSALPGRRARFLCVAVAGLAGALLAPPPSRAQDTKQAWQPKAPEGLPTDFDWIRLPSDEWLKGKIVSMYDGKLEFDSDELGVHTFDFADIKELRSSRVLQVGFAARPPLMGRLVVDGKAARVVGETGETAFDRSEILTIVVGAKREIDYWSGYANLGGTIRSGNSDQIDYTARLGTVRRSVRDRTGIEYIGNITRINDADTSNNHRVTLGWDRFLNKRLFLNLVGLEWYRDPFQNVANRWTVTAGLGYEIVDTPRTTGSVTAGPAWQSTDWKSVLAGEDDSASSVALRVGTRFDHEFTGSIDFYTLYNAFFTDEASGSYTHHFDMGLKIELTGDLNVNASWVWDYVQDPRALEDGSFPKKDDTRLVFGLGWSF
jgi:putative salt-induced outer membrane protein YdiY